MKSFYPDARQLISAAQAAGIKVARISRQQKRIGERTGVEPILGVDPYSRVDQWVW